MYDSLVEGIPLKKSAFTMMELVFVIVVVGILAAAIIPRADRDTLYEAAEQLQSHIKYTQHLALMDDVYDHTDDDWFENRWRITFDDDEEWYAVSKGDTDNDLYAQDPLKRQDIDGDANKEYDLDDKYSVTLSLPGNEDVLAFDNLGRPYLFTGDQDTPTEDLLTGDFNITLNDGTDTATITVTPETGYTRITFD
jgi:prepilin-type N-terminal cleavage/methylation domain-containing protein